MTKNSLFQSPAKVSIADSTFSNSYSFPEWSKFDDEHLGFNISLDLIDQEKWQVTMMVKIELAETLNKGINSYIGFKKLPKLGKMF